jgi:putative flippase GtrA
MKQILKYMTVGLGNAAIDVGVLNLLVQVFGTPLVIANTISATLAITNGYIWHKYWTFNDHSNSHLIQLPLFVGINVLWVALSDTLMHFGTLFLGHVFPTWPYWWQYNLTKAGAAVLFTILNYLTYKFIIFGKRR